MALHLQEWETGHTDWLDSYAWWLCRDPSTWYCALTKCTCEWCITCLGVRQTTLTAAQSKYCIRLRLKYFYNWNVCTCIFCLCVLKLYLVFYRVIMSFKIIL